MQATTDQANPVQSEQAASHADELNEDLSRAKMRTCELEHECRKLQRAADEASVLQEQLNQTSLECSEWQRRHMCALPYSVIAES